MKEKAGIALMVVGGLLAAFYTVGSGLVVGVIGLALFKPDILDRFAVGRKVE